jgi:hypothetical protein
LDKTLILQLVKEGLGIRTNFKDATLMMRVEGAIDQLEDEKGLVLDSTNSNHLEFIVDYASWKYQNWGSDKDMPRHLKLRLNNLMIHNGGGTSGT